MAMDPYKKRMLQGAAQGATTGATAGYMLGGPLGGTLGLIGGGVAGGLMARPGEDEQRFRARLRQLDLGVLGPEAAAIRGRFMGPVRGAAQQQETARRALEQGTVTSGASARRAQAAQTAARRDIGEAAAEAEMAILDLGERRRGMADRMRDRLRREEDQRTRQFRAQMAGDLVGLGTTVGGDIAQQRLSRQAEQALLADQVGAGRGRRNRADLAAMSDEEALEAYTGGLPYIDFGDLPEAADPVAGKPSPVKVSGLGDYAMRAAAAREARRRLDADDPSSVEAAAQAAAAPRSRAAAPARKTLTSTITDQYVPGYPPPTSLVAPEPGVYDQAMEGMGLKEVGTVTEVPLTDEEILARSIGLGVPGLPDPDLAARMLATPEAGVPDPGLAGRMLATPGAGVPDPDLAARMLATSEAGVADPGLAGRMLATDLAGVPDPDLAARMTGGPGVASRMGDAMAARRLGVSIDTADPEYVGFSQAYIGLDPDDRVTLFETYRDLDPEAKQRALVDYAFISDLAGAL